MKEFLLKLKIFFDQLWLYLPLNRRTGVVYFYYYEDYKQECSLRGIKFSTCPKLSFKGGIPEILLKYAKNRPDFTYIDLRDVVWFDFKPYSLDDIVRGVLEYEADDENRKKLIDLGYIDSEKETTVYFEDEEKNRHPENVEVYRN